VADPAPPGELLRRAVDANLQYYTALGRLTIEYLEALGAIARRVEVPLPLGTATVAPAPAPAPPPPPRAPAAMVLEAEAGGTAVGVFLVENLLAEKVSAPVSASSFSAPDGREVTPALAFDPEVVVLDRGEQILVRVATRIEADLEPDISYRGELTVPGIVGTKVPIVLRRRAGAA
jgi:hypothetical protein